MNYITCIIFCLILWLDGSHGNNGHLKLYRNSARRYQIHRNAMSNDVLSSVAQPISTSLDNSPVKFSEHIRIAKDLSSIFCKSNADCTHISSTNICLYDPAILNGICVPLPPNSTATSTTYSKQMIYTIVLFGSVLRN
jgi:hypothetical protein